MKKIILSATAVVLTCGMSGLNAQAVTIIDETNKKAVGHVKWHKQADVDPARFVDKSVPNYLSSLFFIRRLDDDVEQTSANIAVNNRFQVSLQPGSYTQVYSCVGINRLGSEVTGLKTNDLMLGVNAFDLDGGQNYYFLVDVDAQGNSILSEIGSDNAIQMLADKRYQAHQISRVVPDCPAVVTAPRPTPTEPIPTEPTPLIVPVLQEKVSIELEVLFDNDKSIIKPQYYNEIEDVAKFMKKYGNTVTTIEGHTDSNASDSYNQKLSERRANAVKDMLISRFGIEASRLIAIGYGESRPRATNATDAGRQLNRRVIAVVEERQ